MRLASTNGVDRDQSLSDTSTNVASDIMHHTTDRTHLTCSWQQWHSYLSAALLSHVFSFTYSTLWIRKLKAGQRSKKKTVSHCLCIRRWCCTVCKHCIKSSRMNLKKSYFHTCSSRRENAGISHSRLKPTQPMNSSIFFLLLFAFSFLLLLLFMFDATIELSECRAVSTKQRTKAIEILPRKPWLHHISGETWTTHQHHHHHHTCTYGGRGADGRHCVRHRNIN